MSKQTTTNFFIPSPSETKFVELYQVLHHGIGNFQQLGSRLIQLAEHAHAFRQFDQVKEFASLLSNIPIKDYQAIGNYFLAVAANRKGNGDQAKARRLFKMAIDAAPDAYKVRSVLSLGALSFHRKDFDSTLYYYRETIKAGKLSTASLIATRGIATVKSMKGDHRQAVKDLESILPVIKYAPPHIYFDLLNSYAVELGEVGRIDEARAISRLVLASPFAFAYPEWRETSDEINLRGYKSRSTVALNQRITPENLLQMPERRMSAPSAQTHIRQWGSVTRLEDWKKNMANASNGQDTDQSLEAMTSQDMAMKLLELITENRTDEDRLRKVLGYTLEVLSGRAKPE